MVGMDKGTLITVTCLATAIGTFLAAFLGNVPSLKQPFKKYINSLSQEEKIDFFIRTKSKIFLNKSLKNEEKDILVKELKEVYNLF